MVKCQHPLDQFYQALISKAFGQWFLLMDTWHTDLSNSPGVGHEVTC